MIVTADSFGSDLGQGMLPAPASVVRSSASAVLTRRANRLAILQQNHPFGDFLSYVQTIVQIQARLLADNASLAWPRLAARIGAEVTNCKGLPEAARTNAAAVSRLSDREIVSIADRWLGGAAEPSDLARLPVVLAGLQIERLQTPPQDSEGAVESGRCPVCGGPPLAATIGSHPGGLRHVHCALCASSWHVERLHCVACGSEGAVRYLRLEGDERAVRAEACGDCRSYLKTLDTTGIDGHEPLADDLASFDLDMRLAAEGWRRLWPNPFLLYG